MTYKKFCITVCMFLYTWCAHVAAQQQRLLPPPKAPQRPAGVVPQPQAAAVISRPMSPPPKPPVRPGSPPQEVSAPTPPTPPPFLQQNISSRPQSPPVAPPKPPTFLQHPQQPTPPAVLPKPVQPPMPPLPAGSTPFKIADEDLQKTLAELKEFSGEPTVKNTVEVLGRAEKYMEQMLQFYANNQNNMQLLQKMQREVQTDDLDAFLRGILKRLGDERWSALLRVGPIREGIDIERTEDQELSVPEVAGSELLVSALKVLKEDFPDIYQESLAKVSKITKDFLNKKLLESR